MKEKGLVPEFLDSHLEHPAGWIMCALQIFCILILIIMYFILIVNSNLIKSTPRIPVNSTTSFPPAHHYGPNDLLYPKSTTQPRLRDLLHPKSTTLPPTVLVNNWFSSVSTHSSHTAPAPSIPVNNTTSSRQHASTHKSSSIQLRVILLSILLRTIRAY